MLFTKSTLTGDYVHYYSADPALDRDAEEFDHDKWIDFQDESFIPRKNGATPTKFHMRRLSDKQRAWLMDVQEKWGKHDMAFWAVAMSLRRIDPFMVDGKEQDLALITDMGFSRLDDEWVSVIRGMDDGKLYWELAGRVLRETFPDTRD